MHCLQVFVFSVGTAHTAQNATHISNPIVPHPKTFCISHLREMLLFVFITASF